MINFNFDLRAPNWRIGAYAVGHVISRTQILRLLSCNRMAARGSNSATALRRLMTEYRQLTAGGTDSSETIHRDIAAYLITGRFTRWHVYGWCVHGYLPHMLY
jgi:hypothetical protein